MGIVFLIQQAAAHALNKLYSLDILPATVQVNETKSEFEGDYTIVLFGFTKTLKKAPELLGKEIGEYLTENKSELISSYNVIKGFLNLSVSDLFWIEFLSLHFSEPDYGRVPLMGKKVMVEYSSPNT